MISTTDDVKFNTGNRWTTIVRDGIRVHFLYLPYDNNLSYVRRIYVFLKFLVLSSFKVLNIKGDFVLATSTPLTIIFPAFIKKFIHNVPYYFEVRDVWPEAPIAMGLVKSRILKNLLYLLEKLAYKYSTAIITLSTDMKKSISTRYDYLTQGKLYVIENIAEVERFQVSSQFDVLNSTKNRIVLYAGTFGLVNGISYVVELANYLRKINADNIQFHLYGEGKEKPEVINKAKEMDVLDKNVFIYNSVTKAELGDLYRKSTWGSSFVIDLPELWANSANKFFDTLAAGRPLLINYEGWQAEMIRDHNLGYVLPTKLNKMTSDDWVSLKEYFEDEELLKMQGKNAEKLAKGKFSLEIAVGNYLKIFKQHSNN